MNVREDEGSFSLGLDWCLFRVAARNFTGYEQDKLETRRINEVVVQARKQSNWT
jgi:hypothetical protein